MKGGASIINISGIDILYIDFNGLSGEEFLKAIEQTKTFCLQHKEKHYPSITDLKDAGLNGDAQNALKEMGKALSANRTETGKRPPKVVIGLGPLKRAIASRFNPESIYLKSKQEAIDYILENLQA